MSRRAGLGSGSSSMSAIDEQRLVLRAQEGSPRAFDELLRRYQRTLFRHLRRMLPNDDSAYDVLQQTFIAIVRSIRSLRCREHFRPWAYGVATRVCLKAISRSRRGRAPDEDSDGSEAALAYCLEAETSPEALARVRELRDVLRDRVSLLSPRVRSVILLHFYEELSLSEVAAALEIELGTVKSRLATGLKKLRTIEEISSHD